MQRIYQDIPHNPADGQFGNCYQAALASVFSLPLRDVPHFFDGVISEQQAVEANYKAYEWMLRTLGVRMNSLWATPNLSLSQVLEHFGTIYGPSYVWLLSGTTEHGTTHVVVCRGTNIVHDPLRSRPQLIGPVNQQGWYIETFATVATTLPRGI